MVCLAYFSESSFSGQPLCRPPAVWAVASVFAAFSLSFTWVIGHRARHCSDAWQQDSRGGGDPPLEAATTEATLYMAPHRSRASVWPSTPAHRTSLDSPGRGNKSLNSRKAFFLLSKPVLVVKVTHARSPHGGPWNGAPREGRRGFKLLDVGQRGQAPWSS